MTHPKENTALKRKVKVLLKVDLELKSKTTFAPELTSQTLPETHANKSADLASIPTESKESIMLYCRDEKYFPKIYSS